MAEFDSTEEVIEMIGTVIYDAPSMPKTTLFNVDILSQCQDWMKQRYALNDYQL